MLNVNFTMWETIKVIFVNESEIVVDDVSKIEEDESGFVHFKDIYGSDVFVANGKNMIGFLKQ